MVSAMFLVPSIMAFSRSSKIPFGRTGVLLRRPYQSMNISSEVNLIDITGPLTKSTTILKTFFITYTLVEKKFQPLKSHQNG